MLLISKKTPASDHVPGCTLCTEAQAKRDSNCPQPRLERFAEYILTFFSEQTLPSRPYSEAFPPFLQRMQHSLAVTVQRKFLLRKSIPAASSAPSASEQLRGLFFLHTKEVLLLPREGEAGGRPRRFDVGSTDCGLAGSHLRRGGEDKGREGLAVTKGSSESAGRSALPASLCGDCGGARGRWQRVGGGGRRRRNRGDCRGKSRRKCQDLDIRRPCNTIALFRSRLRPRDYLPQVLRAHHARRRTFTSAAFAAPARLGLITLSGC